MAKPSRQKRARRNKPKQAQEIASTLDGSDPRFRHYDKLIREGAWSGQTSDEVWPVASAYMKKQDIVPKKDEFARIYAHYKKEVAGKKAKGPFHTALLRLGYDESNLRADFIEQLSNFTSSDPQDVRDWMNTYNAVATGEGKSWREACVRALVAMRELTGMPECEANFITGPLEDQMYKLFPNEMAELDKSELPEPVGKAPTSLENDETTV